VDRASGRVGSWSGMEIWARFQKYRSLFHCYLTCISGVRFGSMKSKRNSLSRVILECWLGFAGLNVGLEQPIANGAKRTVLPGGGRKQVSLSRRVLPRGP